MNKRVKKLIIIFVTTIFSLAIHALAPESDNLNPEVMTSIVNTLTFVGTVSIFFFVTYYLIATVFLKYHVLIIGSRLKKGLIFGVLIGGIWWIGMIEALWALDSTFFNEFILGFLDFAPIVLLCFLLAVFLIDEKEEKVNNSKLSLKQYGLMLSVFTLVFSAGRSLRYFMNYTGYSVEVIPHVLIWTVVFGMIIGLNALFLRPQSNALRSAGLFTLIIFGVHYFMFVAFIPLIFSGLLLELSFVLLIDLLLVFFASFLGYKIINIKNYSH